MPEGRRSSWRFFCGEEKLFEFQVPVNQKETDGKCDYYSYLNVENTGT